MTFVYPLLLGGLLLAGVPVLLHFLIRQKPKTLLFPAFRFLIQKRRSNTRNLRLRHLLLLALRVALILLICFALARPRLFHEALGLSHEKPVAMVLIFDTSPSMEYKSGEMTRFELAKKRCLELLDQLPEDGRVLILDTSDPASFAREDWLKSLDKARQRIQSLTIRPSSTPVTKAIDEGLRRFDEWDKTDDDPAGANMPRFVCVFSDRTRASWDSGTSAKRGREMPVQMLYFDVGIDDPVDLAITQAELPANRQSFTEGEKIPLRVTVKATGKSMSDSNTVLVKIGGKTVADQAFLVDANSSKTLNLDFDAEKAKLGVGQHQVEVTLETASDALSFNNVRYVTFNIHAPQKILVLADDAKKSQEFAGVLKDLRYQVTLKDIREKVNLGDFQAVFMVSVAAPPEPLWNSLANYVTQGGGLGIVPPGEELDRKAYNSEAAKKIMPATIVKQIELPAGQGRQWNIATSDRRHSFLSPFVRWLVEGDYDLIRNPRSAERFWEVEPVTKDNVIVHYDGTPAWPAVVERQEKGKVLLLTTTMDSRKEAWNNYAEELNSFYHALTMMCAKHLCPEPANQPLNFQFGSEPPVVKLGPTIAFPKYLLSSGEFSEEILFVDGRWVGERLPKQGNYTISGTNPEKQETVTLHKFSIDISGEESDLTRVPIDEIEAVLGKDSLVPQDRKTSLRDTLTWDEPMELFPWLMLAVLFLLAIENLLANRFYRQEPAEG